MSHYGNYKPNFNLESRNSFLSRLRAFFIKRRVSYQLRRKNRCTGLKKASAGAILICLIVGMLSFGGCKVKEVPVEVKYETHYIDSVRLKDSIVYIPTERIVDIVPWYDTLHLEGEVAYSDAWIDTNYHIIQGQLVTKQGKLIEIRYVDRWRTRDSIVEREKPVYIKGDTVTEVKYPWWSWVGLTFTVLCVGYCGWRLYSKFFNNT